MYIHHVEIKNFRLLADVELALEEQTTVIVGRNNSGKSSLLEALRVLCRKGHPLLLQELVAGRDENLVSKISTEDDRFSEVSPLRHLFIGRTFPTEDGQSIEIDDPVTGQYVRIDHVLFRIEEETEKREDGELSVLRKRVLIPKEKLGTSGDAAQALSIKSDGGNTFLPLEMGDDSDRMRRMRFTALEREPAPVSFLSTRFLHPDRIATLWDQAVLTNAEDSILDALRLIEPAVRGLAFVKADDYDRGGFVPSRVREERAVRGERIALVKMEGTQRPIPLSSMGDGMLRVLQLLLAMYPAKGGYFLIDEFENGLHHSVQDGVWELLFTLAKKLNVQVFATTHSNDCIASFARVAEKHTDIAGSLTRLKRIATDGGEQQVVATAFLEPELLMAQEAHIDLR